METAPLSTEHIQLHVDSLSCVCALKGRLTSPGGRGLGKPPQLWVISKDHCWDSLA